MQISKCEKFRRRFGISEDTNKTMKRLPSATYILALAQALNLTTAVISVTIAAVVGTALSENKSLGAVPYGLQFLAVLIFTFPASQLMKKIGRKKIFYIGAGLLFFAGVIGFEATTQKNFCLLCVSHFMLGTYSAIANFYRFAATDSLSEELKARVMSFVVAGGVLAAFIGPIIANHLKSIPGFIDFSLCYASMSSIAILTIFLIYAWNRNKEKPHSHASYLYTVTKPDLPCLAIAIATSSWGYLAMNLLMVQASLVMQEICTFKKTSAAIQAHVVAMFLPSLFTSHFAKKIGQLNLIISGYIFLCISCAMNLLSSGYASLYFSLITLGVGWNFMYVCGGALLSKYINTCNQYKWQGINDTAIALCATVGAFFPSLMFSVFGWKHTNAIIISITLIIFGIVLTSLRFKTENSKWSSI